MKKLMSTCTALLLALCMLLPAYSAFAATDNDKIGQRLENQNSFSLSLSLSLFFSLFPLLSLSVSLSLSLYLSLPLKLT